MAAAKRGELVHRPPKKTEYEIRFATTNARKGWQDLVATIRNPMSDAWDFLTRTPLTTTPTNYRLQGGSRHDISREYHLRTLAAQADS